MTARIEAAAKAIADWEEPEDWHDPECADFRAAILTDALRGLAAADAVMFSEDSIARIADIIAHYLAAIYPVERNPRHSAGVLTRAVIAALKDQP